jgi:hypothetical protein
MEDDYKLWIAKVMDSSLSIEGKALCGAFISMLNPDSCFLKNPDFNEWRRRSSLEKHAFDVALREVEEEGWLQDQKAGRCECGKSRLREYLMSSPSTSNNKESNKSEPWRKFGPPV